MIGSITRANLFNPAPQSQDQHKSDVSPKIAEYARRPEVSGVDAQGRALATVRPPNVFVSDLDQEIAGNIEKHLRTGARQLAHYMRENALTPGATTSGVAKPGAAPESFDEDDHDEARREHGPHERD